MQSEQDFRELLKRYLAGQCTDAERAVVEEWFAQGGSEMRARQQLSADGKGRLRQRIYRRMKGGFEWRQAAIWIGVIVLSAAALLLHSREVKEPAVVIAKVGEVRQVVLPDSSIVVLNAGTTLQYASDFRKSRLLRLSGEACFTVTRDEAHPFQVVADDSVQTTVLGTSFNIRSYPADDKVSVSVLSGKVRVEGTAGQQAILERHQSASVDRNSHVLSVFRNIDTTGLRSWTTGQWVYDNCRFTDLAILLESQYGVKVRGASRLQTSVSVNFTKKQTSAEILSVFCSLAGCRYRMTGEKEATLY